MIDNVVLQRAALDIMCRGRFRGWLGTVPRDVAVIFAGQRIRDDPVPGAVAPSRAQTVGPGFLGGLLWHLRDRGIAVVRLHEALHRLRGSDCSGPLVCFALDDGYADNCRTGLPIFARLGARFAVFLTTGFIDGSVGEKHAAYRAAGR